MDVGPRYGWYIVRGFLYSFGRKIRDRLHEEFLCPEQGKWLPSTVMAYPTSRLKAEKLAFNWVTLQAPSEIGQVHVLRRPVPLSIRIRMRGYK